MTTRIEVRSGTSVEWAAANPILNEGEVGYDSTVDKIKVGDGTAQWSVLAFQGGSGGGFTTEEVDFTWDGTDYTFKAPLTSIDPETHDSFAVGIKKHATEWTNPISKLALLSGGVANIGFFKPMSPGLNVTIAAYNSYFAVKLTADSTWYVVGDKIAHGDKIIVIVHKTAK